MIFKYEASQGEVVRTIGARFRQYRMTMNLTREQAAEQTGLSMTTLYKLDTGRMTDLSLGTILRLLRLVGQYDNWEKILPEIPLSPYLLKDNLKPKQRIRHPKSSS